MEEREPQINPLMAKIMAIQKDPSLTDAEKARKRQELLMGSWNKTEPASPDKKNAPSATNKGKQASSQSAPEADGSLDENLKCAICLNLCQRPVTAPCQHNFCLGCFNKWGSQGKKTCPTCRSPFPSKFAQNPRINTALAYAIRLAKNPIREAPVAAKEYKRIDNESRPEQAFVTERAVRAGRANACSGRIMVNIPNDHFGPIEPCHDPSRGRGVQVGDYWNDRMDCRQWGAHFPHVAGIAGQSNVGAQSVVLSGGYLDDQDEGEWFLYTGSGGRDLSGNKRTNNVQSFDQEFSFMNQALKLSCLKGLPVRVVRSHKEKRSNYAPPEEVPVRYDGIYRILRCWRKPGLQQHLVCRYLFVRCDNSPAPWETGDTGDSVRLEIPREAAQEMKQAKGPVYEMGEEPFWDWLPDEGKWGWAKPRPGSQKVAGATRKPEDPSRKLKKKLSETEKALKEFHCGVCREVPQDPMRTPCGHNYCLSCLHKKFEGVPDIAVNSAHSRTMRVRKNSKPCPVCKADICDFLATAQVNREMMAVIQKLQSAVEQGKAAAAEVAATADAVGGSQEEALLEAEEAAEQQQQQQQDEAGPSGSGADDSDDTIIPVDGPSSPQERHDSISSPAAAMPAAATATTAAAAAPAVATAAATAIAGPSSAAAPASKPQPWATEQAILEAEFPDLDSSLIRGFLEDQGGDLYDVRTMLRKLSSQAKAASRAPRTGTSTAKSMGSGNGSGKGKAKGQKGELASDAAKDGETANAGAAEAMVTEPMQPEAMEVAAGAAAAAGAAEAAAAGSAEGSNVHVCADGKQAMDVDAVAGPPSAALGVDAAADGNVEQKASGRKRQRAAPKSAAAPAATPAPTPAAPAGRAETRAGSAAKRKGAAVDSPAATAATAGGGASPAPAPAPSKRTRCK